MGDEQFNFDFGKSEDQITITLDEDYVTSTGSEYTFNVSDTIDTTATIDTAGLSWDFGNKIDPDRVEKMCNEYPALKKAWDNFYSIYRMVDQDYKDNYEVDDDAPF
tara:strand:+ start:222 stop:539 length:318 start_codon:yes stop_codon:yes gene_type:complete